MNTKSLIKILLCPLDNTVKCEGCVGEKYCGERGNIEFMAAERLNALLIQIRNLQKENKELRQDLCRANKRNENFLKSIKQAVHEQELLVNL